MSKTGSNTAQRAGSRRPTLNASCGPMRPPSTAICRRPIGATSDRRPAADTAQLSHFPAEIDMASGLWGQWAHLRLN